MTRPFDISQAYVSLVSEYAEPVFKLFAEPAPIYQELLQRLGPHGLRLADMKVDWGDQSLADIHLRCHFLNFSATVRLRTERLELWFDLLRVPESQATAIAIGAFEAVKTVHAPTYRSFGTDFAFHGTTDISTREFLTRFVREVPNLGPNIGTGCAFYYGPDDIRLSSGVTFDLSGQVKDGLYIRHNAVWDGSKMEPLTLLSMLPSQVDRWLEADGLSRVKTD